MRTQFGSRILESDICVLCGKRQATTKEHIPPKGLFDERPNDYLLVPACEDCNGSTKWDDEYLLMVMAGGSLVGEGTKIWKKKVVPKFRDFPKTQSGLREQVSTARVKISPTEETTLRIMKLNRQRIEKSIRKMVWGLHWFHTGNILAQHTQLNVGMLNAADAPAYFKDPKNLEYYDQTVLGIYRDQLVMNTFFYTVAISEEISLWYFFFYKQNAFIVSVQSSNN